MKDSVKKWWHIRLKRPYVLSADVRPGSGGVVVLIHGVNSKRQFWTPLIKLLETTDLMIITIDLLGHGTSPRPTWAKYDIEEQSVAVIKTLKKLGVTRQAVVVGHSMGSLVATHMAVLRPKLVKRLVLYQPPIFADSADFPRHVRRRKLYFGIFERLANNPKGTITLTKAIGLIATEWAQARKSQASWLPIERSLRNTIMQQSIFHELHDISVPTAIVHGRLDVIVTRTELRKMYRSNPNITFHKTTVNHGINSASARSLYGIILPKTNRSV